MALGLSHLVPQELRELEPYRPGLAAAQVASGGQLLRLSANENTQGPAAAVRQVLTAAVELSRYPDGNGTALKQALAEHHGVAPEQLTLGAGSNEALLLVAQTLMRPGLEGVHARYSFIVYPSIIRIAGGMPVQAEAVDRGHDVDALLAAVTPRTRLIYVANPNNPTGTWLRAAQLRRLLETLPEHVVTVVDEAYFEYLQDEPDYPDCIRWIEQFPRLVVTRTFSKVYGLAALRIGYAVSCMELAELMNRVRQPFNVSQPALVAARVALAEQAHVAHSVRTNHAGTAQWREAAARLGIAAACGGGNFVLLDLQRPAQSVHAALLAAGVVVRPLQEYGLPECLRVTIGTACENAQCIAALEQALGRDG